MKKKEMLVLELVALIVGVTAIGIGIYLSINFYPKKEMKSEYNKLDTDIFGAFSLTNKKTVKLCIVKESCKQIDPIFSKISYSKKNKIIETVIQEINKTTEEYYNQMKNSTMESPTCETVKTKYNYSILPNTYYSLFENEQYTSIAIAREITDLCTMKTDVILPVIYFYDKKAKKILTEEEKQRALQITDNDVLIAITNSYVEREKIEGTKKNIEDLKVNGKLEYSLYYSTEGNLIALYWEQDERGIQPIEVVVK